jgi:hypothetical protein
MEWLMRYLVAFGLLVLALASPVLYPTLASAYVKGDETQKESPSTESPRDDTKQPAPKPDEKSKGDSSSGT